jgi:type IV secretion system protein VirB10
VSEPGLDQEITRPRPTTTTWWGSLPVAVKFGIIALSGALLVGFAVVSFVIRPPVAATPQAAGPAPGASTDPTAIVPPSDKQAWYASHPNNISLVSPAPSQAPQTGASPGAGSYVPIVSATPPPANDSDAQRTVNQYTSGPSTAYNPANPYAGMVPQAAATHTARDIDVGANVDANGSAPRGAALVNQDPTVPPIAMAAAPAPTTAPTPSVTERFYSGYQVEHPLSKYELHRGDDIPVTINGALRSDQPGLTKGIVQVDVKDSVYQRCILIPRGSIVVLSYKSGVTNGQNTISLNGDELFFRNGDFLALDDDPGTDPNGAPGVSANVNNHLGNVVSATLLTAALGYALDRATQSGNNTSNSTVTVNSGVNPVQQAVGNLANTVIGNAAAQPPTLTVDPATVINLVVEKTIPFKQTWGCQS